MEDQTARIVGGQRGGEAGGDAGEEEAAGILVESDGASEEAGQDRTEGRNRHEAAVIFDQEVGTEIGVATLNADVGLANLEIAFDAVIAEAPARAVGFGVDFSQ